MNRTLVACWCKCARECGCARGVVTLTLAQQLQQSPYAPKVGDPPEVSNMRLVGYSDLQARSSYQPTFISRAIATSPMWATMVAAPMRRSRSIR